MGTLWERDHANVWGSWVRGDVFLRFCSLLSSLCMVWRYHCSFIFVAEKGLSFVKKHCQIIFFGLFVIIGSL